MPLDVTLIKKELGEQITELAQSSKIDSFDLFNDNTVTRTDVENSVIVIAQSVWKLIEKAHKEGKSDTKCKITCENPLEQDCEKLVWLFLKKVYKIATTIEELPQEESQGKKRRFDQSSGNSLDQGIVQEVFRNLFENKSIRFASSSCTRMVTWKNNPSLTPYPLPYPAFPVPQFSKTIHPSDLASNTFRTSKELCDVVLKVGDQEFSAHRIILAARASYFKSLFLSGMKESQSSEVIPIKETTSHSFSRFLEAVYLQYPPQEKLSLEELFEFATLANRMGAIELFQWSEVHIKNMISHENFYLIASYACSVGDKYLMGYCTWYFSQYSKEMPMLDLEKLSLQEVVDYMDVSVMIQNKDLETSCKEHIRSGISLKNFKDMCQLAIDQAQRGSTSLKKLCTEYVKANKAAFEQEGMKEAKELYKTLMSGLE